MAMVLQIRVLAALTALVAVAPLGAVAQQPAAPDAPPAPPPTYAAPPPSYSSTDEVINGRVSSFDGAYSLRVNDERGYIDNVQLRQGTVINPTGIRLAAGMAVTIHGVNRGSVFAANVIDTPYQSYGAIPVYPYGAYPYPVYPYPAYGYPFYPVRIGIGFGFGFHGGGYGYHRW
jgi:hypothetical protein